MSNESERPLSIGILVYPSMDQIDATGPFEVFARMVARLRGETEAQEIQLDLVYAPEPPFHAGTPESAPPEILRAVKARYQPITEARERTARAFAARFGASSVRAADARPALVSFA